MTNGHEPGHFARQAQASKNYGAQKQATYGGSTSLYPRSTIEFPVMNNDDPKRVHPTQKPVELFRYLIRTYSDPTDHILDFCAGAGTTGVAARAEGRHATLIDSHPTFAAHMRRVFQTQWLA
jgi:site-specific DNA-methyltransferase (adenine-specific)